MANAGTVTFGVKVLDENRVDMTRYVSWDDHKNVLEQLRAAKTEAEEWENRYWEFVSEHGGVS